MSKQFEKSIKATQAFEAINPLMYEESNPVGIKEVLRIKGICGNNVRLPLLPASQTLSKRIKTTYNKKGQSLDWHLMYLS